MSVDHMLEESDLLIDFLVGYVFREGDEAVGGPIDREFKGIDGVVELPI